MSTSTNVCSDMVTAQHITHQFAFEQKEGIHSDLNLRVKRGS